ncbi:hypothetical protein ABBQ32_013961 [Trebouxia sp. C0010 RCD-2024]
MVTAQALTSKTAAPAQTLSGAGGVKKQVKTQSSVQSSKEQTAAGPQQGDTSSRLPACSLNDFKVDRVLGTGSFGRVSLAQHIATGRICAIKALSKANIVRNQQVCPALLSSAGRMLQACTKCLAVSDAVASQLHILPSLIRCMPCTSLPARAGRFGNT